MSLMSPRDVNPTPRGGSSRRGARVHPRAGVPRGVSPGPGAGSARPPHRSPRLRSHSADYGSATPQGTCTTLRTLRDTRQHGDAGWRHFLRGSRSSGARAGSDPTLHTWPRRSSSAHSLGELEGRELDRLPDLAPGPIPGKEKMRPGSCPGSRSVSLAATRDRARHTKHVSRTIASSGRLELSARSSEAHPPPDRPARPSQPRRDARNSRRAISPAVAGSA